MWKMAWRNLWRNRTRTAVTITAIALTYSLYIMMVGIQEYMYSQMQDAAATAAGGMVLVQAAGYQDEQLNTQVIRDGGPLVESLRALPTVEQVAPRVILNGLLSTSASSLPARVQGIDPAAEREFQDLTEYVREGTLLADSDEESPIVLGSKIVEDLELALGDRVILSVNGPDGEMQRALFYLTGVLHTNSDFTDGALAFTTIAAARNAVRDDAILTQVGVLGVGTSTELAAAVRTAVPADALEVLTWQEAMPDLIGFIEMDRAYGDVMAIVIFLVVWFSIMNTFLMVVMERVRELGLLGALGMTPRRVAQLVLTETFLLAVVAIVVGLLVGVAGHLTIDHFGIDVATLYGTTEEIEMAGIAMADQVIYSELSSERITSITFSVLVMVLLGAIYPAVKAMRMQPADAMRFYE